MDPVAAYFAKGGVAGSIPGPKTEVDVVAGQTVSGGWDPVKLAKEMESVAPPKDFTCQVPYVRGIPLAHPGHPDKGVNVPDGIICYKGPPYRPFWIGTLGWTTKCDYIRNDEEFAKQVTVDGQQVQTIWHHTGPHLKTIENPMSDPDYQGYFLKTNAFDDDYKDYFPKNDQPGIRSQALRDSLTQQCNAAKQRFGKLLTEYHPAHWPANHRSVVENGSKWIRLAGAGGDQNDSFSFGDLNGGKGHGGPCLWCAKGIGNWIPKTVPMPYSGPPGAPEKDLSCTENFAARIQANEYKLSKGISPHMGTDYGQPTPMAIQPNGGVQILWREHGRPIAHLLYLDCNLKPCAPDIVFEAIDIGGIVAFNDGTLVLCGQKECDGPTTWNRFTAMVKITVIYWKNGKLEWVRTLSDPYRKVGQSQGMSYVENTDGSADHADNNNLFYAQLAYDDVSKTVSIYTLLTGGKGGLTPGGGHQGGRLFQIDLTGKVIHDVLACSHSWGLRMLATPNHINAMCADDWYGIWRVESKKYPLKGVWKRDKCCQIKMFSLVKRKGVDEFFMLFLYKQSDVGVMYLDRDLALKKIIYIIKGGERSIHSAQLMPYEGADKDTFLLFWHHSSCPVEGPNLGPRKCNGLGSWQIITFNETDGGEFVGKSKQYDSTLAIHTEDNPQVHPVNGDLMWFLVNKQWGRMEDAPKTQPCYLTLFRMRNCIPDDRGGYKKYNIGYSVWNPMDKKPKAPTSKNDGMFLFCICCCMPCLFLLALMFIVLRRSVKI